MSKNKKPYSDPRWTQPLGIRDDGKPSAIATGTKHYASEEERQKDIETTRCIREMFKKRIEANRNRGIDK